MEAEAKDVWRNNWIIWEMVSAERETALYLPAIVTSTHGDAGVEFLCWSDLDLCSSTCCHRVRRKMF